MGKGKFITFIFISIGFLFNYRLTFVNNIDLFREIVNISKGQVVEYGIRTHFNSEINGQELSSYFISKLSADEDTTIGTSKVNGNYYIDFKKGHEKGSINIVGDERINDITIEVIEESKENRLDMLEEKYKSIISGISKNNQRDFKYLKVKMPANDLLSVQREVTELLKNNGAANISTVKLEKGYSTSAYTSKYKPKSNNGKLMDLNYALCNYNSGSFLIVGTPEIFTSY